MLERDTFDGDDLLFDLLDTRVGRQDAAMLRWHHLYAWPAVRAMERRWPTLRVLP